MGEAKKMLRFSELTLPQKTLIKEMREGKILRLNRMTDGYTLSDGQYTFNVNYPTAWSLNRRHFIYECFRDENFVQFCVNISIDYGKYLDDHNNLIGC
jgi:hypothetical protein